MNRLWAIGMLAGMLVGCAVLGLQAPKDLGERIAYADKEVQAVAEVTDRALLAKSITKAQAQQVSTILHDATPFLDAAKDAPGEADAERNINLAIAILQGLDKFVGAKP